MIEAEAGNLLEWGWSNRKTVVDVVVKAVDAAVQAVKEAAVDVRNAFEKIWKKIFG